MANPKCNATEGGPPPQVAYLVNQYPSVSHTFIRREIHALEARGYRIARFAIRRGPHIADPADEQELALTRHVLSASPLSLVWSVVAVLFRRPMGAFRALCVVLAMAGASDRGYARHIAYWVEAAWLSEAAEREKVEHVHVHFGTNAAAAARLMKLMCGMGYSMTVHGPDEFDNVTTYSLPGKLADSEFCVAVSSYGASQLRRWSPPEWWDRIQVVRCMVGADWFRDEPVEAGSNTLVFAGRLAPQKGIFTLLDAFAEVARMDPTRRLVLVGDGEMRAEVDEVLRSRNLTDQVRVTGWQSEAEVRQHLAGARALVLASYAEGLPVVLMEAMAMRRPVVATRIMGIPELVRDGIDGWLVTPGDSNALARAMELVYATPVETLNAMGRSGQNQVRTMHLAEVEAEKLDRLFRQYVVKRDA